MVETALKIIAALLVTAVVASLLAGTPLLMLPFAAAAWMTWIVARVLDDL